MILNHSRGLLIFACVCLLPLLAAANDSIRVDIQYTDPMFDFEGPLSMGLAELPAEVNASILLTGVPTQSITDYSLADVDSFELAFGDGVATELESFSMIIRSGRIATLSYQSLPFDSPTSLGWVVVNFPLTIQGTDRATNEAFSYTYANSTQSFSVVPEPSMFAMGVGLGLAAAIRRRR